MWSQCRGSAAKEWRVNVCELVPEHADPGARIQHNVLAGIVSLRCTQEVFPPYLTVLSPSEGGRATYTIERDLHLSASCELSVGCSSEPHARS